jgi:hypothetical protein
MSLTGRCGNNTGQIIKMMILGRDQNKTMEGGIQHKQKERKVITQNDKGQLNEDVHGKHECITRHQGKCGGAKSILGRSRAATSIYFDAVS